MKTITSITEQVSERALAAAIPTDGVASISVTKTQLNEAQLNEAQSTTPGGNAGQIYRCLRNPRRFSANYRIEAVVEDAAVGTVFDGVSFTYGAGIFSDALTA